LRLRYNVHGSTAVADNAVLKIKELGEQYVLATAASTQRGVTHSTMASVELVMCW
jgi:hypothetical protein